jgi:hypothetical protein
MDWVCGRRAAMILALSLCRLSRPSALGPRAVDGAGRRLGPRAGSASPEPAVLGAAAIALRLSPAHLRGGRPAAGRGNEGDRDELEILHRISDSTAFGATIYVDPDLGDDENGDGTSTLPFASIFAALSHAVSHYRDAAVLLAPGRVYAGRRYAVA